MLAPASILRFSLAIAIAVSTTLIGVEAKAADVVAPTRVQLVRLAEAELDAGRPAGAAMTATRVIEDPPQRTEGATEVAAWEKAREVFVTARARAAHLTVGVTGGIGVTVDVDGTAVSRTSDLLVDPGEHVIVARSEGFDSAATTVRVKAGESRGVALTLIRKLAPSTSSETIAFPPSTTTTNPNSAITPPDEPMQPQRVAAIATLGAGAAALVVGAVAAVVAVNKANEVRERCLNNTCPLFAMQEVDSARTWGKVSTVAFVTSGVLLGTSVVLFLTGGNPKSPTSSSLSSSSSSSSSSKPSVSLNVGAGSAFLLGKF